MWLRHIRIAILATLVATQARADDVSSFHAAVEEVASHNRAVISYLRTENVDLAVTELDRLRAAFGDLVARLRTPPEPLLGNPLYLETMVDGQMRIITASMMIDMGRLDLACESLQALRKALSDLRRAGKIEVLADCVLDANTAMEALTAFRDTAPDLAAPATAADLAAKAKAYADTLRRCETMAPPEVRDSAEFRRLFDGAQASLALVPKAVETRDPDLLYRVLIELISFDNLIAFRFG